MANNIMLRIASRGCRIQRRRRSRLFAVLIAAAMAAPAMGSAEPSAAVRKVIPQPKVAAKPMGKSATRRTSSAAKAKQTAVMPLPTAAPPTPRWPVNDPPQQATVTWGAQGMIIDARNSSLEQILSEIVTQTGVKVEGMGKDVRVFGVYGPGQPRDVLSELLDGTNYNILMVGEGERGVPEQIVLSTKAEGGIQPNAPVSEGDMYEAPQAPYEPQPTPMQQPVMRPNQGQRTPQQILQEMQQRQQLLMREQQMQQQQQQQQQQQ
jgi:hypothetical protein